MSTIHIGHHRIVSLAGGDGSVIPPATITAVSSSPNLTSVVDEETGLVTLTAVESISSVSVTYGADGYLPTTNAYTVPPPASIVVTEGPEV